MAKRIRWNEMDKSTTPFRKLRAAFVVYNQTTGKSPHTVHWYEFRLELFERWLGPADVTIPNVRAYIADLQGRTQIHVNNRMVRNKEGALSSSYISGFARALRAFASWLHADGYTSDNLLRTLKPPKIQQKVVEALSDEEVTRLIAIVDRDDAIGARDSARCCPALMALDIR
jgi:site-specific recombinase XerD